MTERQKKFCDYYIKLGDATKAAIKAGYSKKTAYSIGSENLRKPEIAEYIAKRQKETETERTADMVEVKEFWASVLRNKKEQTANRIKVSELIAKTNGAFIENLNVNDSSKATSLLESINKQISGKKDE